MKYFLTLGFLFIFLHFFGQEQILITEKYDNINLSKALKKMGKNYDLQLAFNAKIFKKTKITINLVEVDVLTALSKMISSLDYQVKLINNVYVFYPKKPKDSYKHAPEKFDFVWSSVVKDYYSHEVLSYATLSVQETGETVSANVNGIFTLFEIPSDTSTIIVDYIGYPREYIKLTPAMVKSNQPLFLIKNTVTIDDADIVFKGSSILSNSQTTQTLDLKVVSQLPDIGEKDLFRTIQLLPSIDNTTERAGSLQIRGGASDENLIIMDGFTLYHIDHFYQMYSTLNSSAIKNVRIHKGWYEPKFGGRSSGIIEIQGKDGNLNVTKTEIGANFNSFNLFFESPLETKKSSVVIAARRSISNIFTSSLYESIFNTIYNSSSPNLNVGNAFDSTNNPQFDYYDINLKFHFELSKKTKVNFSFFNSNDKLLIEQNNQVPELGFALDYKDQSNWKNFGYSSQWNHQWNEKWFSNASVGYSTYTSKILSEDVKNDFWFNEVDTLQSDENTLLSDFTIRLNNEVNLRKHQIGFGFHHTINKIDFKKINPEGVAQTTSQSGFLSSLYLQDEYTKGKFTVVAGGRVSYYNVLKKILPAPRLKIKYQIQDSLSFEAYFGENYQVIRNTQRQDLFTGVADIWELADTDLPINSSHQYGLEISKIFKNLEFNISVYHRQINNSLHNLNTSPIKFENQTSDFSIGKKIVDGLDFQVVKPKGRHRGWASISLLQVYHKEHSAIPYEFFDDNDQFIQGKIAYIYNTNKWKFGAVFVYGSGKPYTKANNLYDLTLVNGETRKIISYELLNSSRLPVYHRLDLAFSRVFDLSKTINNERSAEIGLSIFNVYNRNNISDIKYFAVGRTNDSFELLEKRISMLGFLPGIKFKLRF